MPFQQVQAFVDGPVKPDALCKGVDGPDAAVGDGPVAVGHVVVDGASREHGPVGGGVARLVESAFDSGLASSKPGAENRFHLKSLVGSGRLGSGYFHKPRKLLRISSFLTSSPISTTEITLR